MHVVICRSDRAPRSERADERTRSKYLRASRLRFALALVSCTAAAGQLSTLDASDPFLLRLRRVDRFERVQSDASKAVAHPHSLAPPSLTRAPTLPTSLDAMRSAALVALWALSTLSHASDLPLDEAVGLAKRIPIVAGQCARPLQAVAE